ncbi:MAG: biopolymer transporter ExbD [Elusimicrobia bacterium]|nr:biopolymer transporter ExbD [Elusimicrobiota bacterium]
MAGPWRRDDEADPISDVNVVPLADVSLVLLIILLVLSPMTVESRLHVKTAARSADDAPSPAPALAAEPPQRVKDLVLMVDLGPAGVMVGDTFFADRREFLAYMRLDLSTRADRKVFLAPHPDVPHGMVVETIEQLKACGADAVALVQTREWGSD